MRTNTYIFLTILFLTVVLSACTQESERSGSAQCTVTTTAQNSTITCPDGTTAVIPHGKDGAVGSPGTDGTNGLPGTDGTDGTNGSGTGGACILSTDFYMVPEGEDFQIVKFLEENECTIIVGNIEIAYYHVPKALAKTTHIYGNLNISNSVDPTTVRPGETTSPFTGLIQISGNLTISNKDDLTDDLFPNLKTIGGALNIQNTNLETLKIFKSLKSIDGNIAIQSNENLIDVNDLFDGLDDLTDNDVVFFENSSALDECMILQKVGDMPGFTGTVVITDQPSCV